MHFFIFAHFFFPFQRCYNFVNKIRRHDLTTFLNSYFSVDFLQKVSVIHAFPPCLTSTRKFSENRNFHRKTQKFDETQENSNFFFIFFRKSRFFLQRNLQRNWQKNFKNFSKKFQKISKKNRKHFSPKKFFVFVKVSRF